MYETKNQCNELNKTETVPADESDFNTKQFTAADLKNIQLKDYSGKCTPDKFTETCQYVEIQCAADKKIVVKKTSLCWLLGKESTKLSSDRLLRVRAQLPKHTKSVKYVRKQMQRPKRVIIKRKQKKVIKF